MQRSVRITLAALVAVIALSAAQFAAAQVTFFEREGLRGRSFTADGPVQNFAQFGFNDRASSVIVQRGQWLVCDDADYRGNCITLRTGQYPSLRSMGLNNAVSSTRPVRGKPQYGYAPPPPKAPAYAYYPRYGERTYQANVVAVRAVMGPPQQRCWIEQQQVVQNNQANIPGAIIGGVVGGVIGHQIGNGRGNDVATAVGAVGGAAIGANVNRGTSVSTQGVQRCASVPGSEQPSYWDVTYDFRGRLNRVQLTYSPGPTITVNERGEPRA
jgi:uncharacterized protein YcfJ